ncbi:MAG: imidazolonepropionase [Chitinophagales bacterium]|jgi:imidazolonepropionase|nr:imidazolonepropionase [Chitinophagales bacterium]
MKKIFTNIGVLYGVNEEKLPYWTINHKPLQHIKNAFLSVGTGFIQDYGEMRDLNLTLDKFSNVELIDCQNAIIIPGFVDSHTHLVYGIPRVEEFLLKIQGKSYEEIAASGGGILNSAEKLSALSFDTLYNMSEKNLKQALAHGTTSIEIKSGYGLSIESELKILRVIHTLKQNFKHIHIKSTFLGAHAVPKAHPNKEAYLNEVVFPLIPKIAKEGLVDYVDAFIEKNYFDTKDMIDLISLAHQHNLKTRFHVNQFHDLGAIALAVERNAVSLDHLEVLTPEDIEILAQSKTVATLLPACSFFTRLPYGPAREIIDHGGILSLATDYNPGSAPSLNMAFVMTLACIQMKLMPEEALTALTLNPAFSLGLSNKVGSIERGKEANFIVLENFNTLSDLPYFAGNQIVKRVFIRGVENI